MRFPFRIPGIFAFILVTLSGCGGGGGGSSTPATVHAVTISWQANHEKAVNSPGGGYIVNVSGQPPITVAYATGPTTSTSAALSLSTGTYTATVTAYSALNPPGGSSGSQSTASAPLTINVP